MGFSSLEALDGGLGDLASRWVDRVLRRPRTVVSLCVGASLLIALAALPRLGIDSNEDALFSEGAG